MKKKDVIVLNSVLNELKDIGSTRFKIFCLENIEALESALSPLKKVEDEIKDILKEFNSERDKVIIEIGKRRENGDIYIDPEDAELIEKFNEKMGPIIESHQEDINDYEKRIKEYNDVLDEEVETNVPEFSSLGVNYFPEEGIKTEQLKVLRANKMIAK